MNALRDCLQRGESERAMISPKMTNLPGGHIDLNFEINENPPKK